MELTLAHWLYFIGTCLIILTMLFRQNVVVPALLMTFIIGVVYSQSFLDGIHVIFNANLTAARELFHIFLIIAIMTSLLQALKSIGSDEQMIVPFQKIMNNGHWSFWIIVFVTYALSLFFWPAPAVPLIGALLIPVAIRSGLPPLATAIAVSLAGHGMALSSDFVLQVAPGLSASTSSVISATVVADRSLILSLITGAIALTIVYLVTRKNIVAPSNENLIIWEKTGEKGAKVDDDHLIIKKGPHSKWFAFIVPLTFLAIVIYVILATFTSVVPTMRDGSGASLIGGTAIILLLLIAGVRDYKKSLQEVSDHLINGFVYSFKVMGLVIPVAGFFFIGSSNYAASILRVNEESSPTFLFDLVQASQSFIPDNALFTGFGILLLGMISGLDGSGFSGLPLIGSLAEAFSATSGVDAATLASIGQVGAIWVGGGTLVAWSPIIAIAGFARISVIDLVRKSFFPVVIGLSIETLFGLLFL
ncbi:hypothetical protein [Halalkalibacter hemicellulosilyticus]|uniref:Uncharacterized protein n=1 Tax=Halalkalibacter hemicellulosilyticusJCM 9152 TaxID=1236971 RepID=W4QGA9_9BACI|nr:hypothetical protein [Halalkalibacter hemicellulosilyticus]GAE30937.1 hypothetical protein JCM9152_2370 [Halalkalibacter hemicellulosilyticusJCM 9152]